MVPKCVVLGLLLLPTGIHVLSRMLFQCGMTDDIEHGNRCWNYQPLDIYTSSSYMCCLSSTSTTYWYSRAVTYVFQCGMTILSMVVVGIINPWTFIPVLPICVVYVLLLLPTGIYVLSCMFFSVE